jgi:hypothetical protein
MQAHFGALEAQFPISFGAPGKPGTIQAPSSNRLHLKSRIEIPQAVLVRQLQGESVLLNLESESYFGLDEVGTRMFSALSAADCIDSAIEALLGEFDVDPDRLRADVGTFIEELAAAGLIRVATV